MIKYNNGRPFISDKLRVMDCITQFTKEEEEKYSLKPTGLNAMIINIKSDTNKEYISEASNEKMTISYTDEEKTSNEKMTISFTDEDKKSKVWVKFENEEIVIIKSKGPISKLPLIEQNTKLNTVLLKMGEEFNARMTPEEVREKMLHGGTIDLDKLPKREISDSIVESTDCGNILKEIFEEKPNAHETQEQIMNFECPDSFEKSDQQNSDARQLKKTFKNGKKH